MARIQIEEKIIEMPKVTQTVMDTVGRHHIQIIEAKTLKIVTRVALGKKPIIQARVTHTPKFVKQQVMVRKEVRIGGQPV